MNPALLALLAVVCLVMLSVSMLRRSERRRATGREVTREHLARLREQREVGGSLDELLVRLEEFSRSINAQIETRCVKLETLLRDADARIAKLERLRGVEPQEEVPQAAAPGVGAAMSERRERIHALADGGANAAAIANELRMPLGEVELVLNVRRYGEKR